MTKNHSEYVEFMGYDGPPPLAFIFWYQDGECKFKTVCYDEEELMFMYKRYLTPGDFYNKLEPSVRKVSELPCEIQKTA